MSRRLLSLLLLLASYAAVSVAQAPPPTTGALLLWVGQGTAPERRAPNTPSQVAALLPDGSLATLIEFDPLTVGVQRCSSQPFSADGRRFAFFASQPTAGAERGTLYQMTDFGAPAVIGSTHTLTCALDNFGYSPNGARLAYIDFLPFADTDENATGMLRVLDAETLDELDRFERAVAFTLTNTELYYLQFFPTADNLVDEVAVSVWDGQDSREISAITSRATCRFSGGSISPAGEQFIAVLLGEKCRGGGRATWQLYLVDRQTRASTLLTSAVQPGTYFPATQTYNLYATHDSAQLVLSFADSLARNSATVARVDLLAPDAAQPIIERAASMRRYVPFRFSLPDVAPATRSWNDRYWAMAVDQPGGVDELAVVDLTAVDAPIRIQITRSSDSVRAMAFTPDSGTLIYITGGLAGADTSLYHLDLEQGIETRVARGQYAPAIAVRADQAAALIQYRLTTEAVPRVYTDLVLVEADGAQRDLLGGVVLDDEGFFDGFRFAVPLAWR